MLVAVSNGYSRHNVGDWLLLSNAVELVRMAHPGAEVIAIAMDADSFANRLGTTAVVDAPVTRRAPLRESMLAAVALATRCRLGPARLRRLRMVDRAYSCGGGFLQMRSAREVVSVSLVHLVQLALMRRLGIPLTMLPQSVGPFEGRLARAVARTVLRWFETVTVRERRSLAHLKELDSELAARVHVAPDLAFLQPHRPLTRASAAGRLRIGVVVRQWWFPGAADPRAAYARYVERVARFIELARESGHDPQLVVHSDGPTVRGDDRIAIRDVLAELDEPAAVVDVASERTLDEVTAAYARYDMVVSTRLHAALFALSTGVPAAALDYEWKSAGIFDDLGLADWHRPIDDWEPGDMLTTVERLEAYPIADVATEFERRRARLEELARALGKKPHIG